MRHPMLTGFALWALAHILVNGDGPSVVLFGGLLLWALAEIVIINRAEPQWSPPPRGRFTADIMWLGGAVIAFTLIGWLHGLVGPSPFPT